MKTSARVLSLHGIISSGVLIDSYNRSKIEWKSNSDWVKGGEREVNGWASQDNVERAASTLFALSADKMCQQSFFA